MGSGIFDAVWSTATIRDDPVPYKVIWRYRVTIGNIKIPKHERKKKGVLSQCMDPYTFCNYVEY
jgi:hypothetical protein